MSAVMRERRHCIKLQNDMPRAAKRASPEIHTVLTLELVKRLAGPTYFKRGEKYFEEGTVRNLMEWNGTITAVSRGTDDYRVRFTLDGRELEYDCSCPVGKDGGFCKHCVAVAIAWLDARRKGAVSHGGLDTLSAMLGAMQPAELVQIIIEEAARNPALRNRLLAGSMKELTEEAGLEEWLATIDRITEVDVDHVDYDRAIFHEELEKLVEMLARLAKRKESAAMAVELIERAIDRLDDLILQIESPQEEIGDTLADLSELHLTACRVARPDPVALAERLFQRELEQTWETIDSAYETYGVVLGAEGRRHYRMLAESEWEKIPPVKSESVRAYNEREERLRTIMESLARSSRDVEDVARIREKYLTNISDYLDLAYLYKKAGNDMKAIEVAERGRKEFADSAAIDLREFLIKEYTRLGMHDQHMKLLLDLFKHSPSLESYMEVKKRAEKMGVWKEWREKTLAVARKGAARPARRGRKPASVAENNSLIVEILLWEKDADAAWQEAIEGDCSDPLWRELAAACEKSRPDDAIAIYQTLIEKWTESWQQYENVIELLERLEQIMRSADRDAEFVEYLDEIRTTGSRKRKLMELIEEAFPSGARATARQTPPPPRRGIKKR